MILDQVGAECVSWLAPDGRAVAALTGPEEALGDLLRSTLREGIG